MKKTLLLASLLSLFGLGFACLIKYSGEQRKICENSKGLYFHLKCFK